MKRVIFVLIVIFSFTDINAQSMGASGGSSSVQLSDTSTIAKAKFVPAPLINYNRSIGFSGGLVPMYMWNINKRDTISPQSLLGGLGMYSTNKTFFGMGFGRLFLDEDKYRVMFGAGYGNVNFQVFLSGINNNWNQFVDYGTSFTFAMTKIQRKVIGHWYAGAVLQYTNFTTSFDTEIETPELQNEFFGLGFMIYRDSRDNVYYPYSGDEFSLEWDFFPTWVINEESSNYLEGFYNHFIPIRKKKDVLALRAYGKFVLGQVSFNQEVVVMGSDLRGYTQGAYRGEGFMDLQAEYRYNFGKKLGAVGFVGFGTIYGDRTEEHNWSLIPSVGTGIRYNVFPSNHMNIGLDVAKGKDDWGLYFRIGEAF